MLNFAAVMKDSARRLVASLLLALFVAFAAGNMLCVHTHVGPAGTVTHSHPYLPSSHHGHASAELETLAAFNSLNFDADGGGCVVVAAHGVAMELGMAPELRAAENEPVACTLLRAPPSVV